MRGKQHRSPLLLQLQNDVAHFAPADRIEAGHRLIEDHDFRIVQNGLSQPDTLKHAFRIFAQLKLFRRFESDFFEHARHALFPVRRRQSVNAREIIQQLGRGQVVVEVRLLRESSRSAGAWTMSEIDFPGCARCRNSGKISRTSSLMVVDLPAPFGPRNPNTSPCSTSMVKPLERPFLF